MNRSEEEARRGLEEAREHIARLESENRELRELRERTRARFEVEQRRTRAILERITDAFVALDNDWRYVYVNDKAATMFGRQARSLIGKHIWTEFPEGVGQPFHQAYERAVAEQVPIRIEEYYPPWNRWFENRIFPSTDGVSIFFEDITDRKVAEEQLRSANNELQAVLDAMSETVIACDREGRVRLANHAALALIAASPARPRAAGAPPSLQVGEILSRLEVRNPDGRPFTHDETAITRALQREQGSVSDALIRVGAQRDRLYRFAASPLRDRDGTVRGALAVGRDVTEQVEFARMKDDFVTAAAHELKTPLAVIRLSAQLVAEQWSRGAASTIVEGRLQSILRGVDRMDHIVSDLVQLTAAALGQIVFRAERLDASGLVEEVAAARRAEGRTLHVRTERAWVRADPVRLRYVFAALVDNALKWSAPDQAVDLTVTVERGRAVVRVVDRGAGIPEAGQARLFEAFFRAHAGTARDFGGMGIGLHLARRFLERMNGAIDFVSTEDVGSTFCVTLPLADPEASP